MSGKVVSVSNSKGDEDGSRAASKIVLVKSVLRKTGSSLSGSAQRDQAAPAEGELQPVAQANVVVNAVAQDKAVPVNDALNINDLHGRQLGNDAEDDVSRKS